MIIKIVRLVRTSFIISLSVQTVTWFVNAKKSLFACSTGRRSTPAGRTICLPKLAALRERFLGRFVFEDF